MLFARFDVRIEDDRLLAHIWGEPIDRARHAPAVEVKGPTFTQLHVLYDSTERVWIAQCVVARLIHVRFRSPRLRVR